MAARSSATTNTAGTVRRGRGRPPGNQTLTSREEVIAAAERAIRAVGVGVSMAAIATEAGVTKPTVYRTVGDKEAIAEGVAEQLSLRVEQLTLAAIASTDDPREQFSKAARAFFELMERERSLYLFVEYGWGSSDGQQLARMIDRSAQPLIETTRLIPGASDSAARTRAYATVGALRTVATMWVRDSYCDIDELVEDMTNYVFR